MRGPVARRERELRRWARPTYIVTIFNVCSARCSARATSSKRRVATFATTRQRFVGLFEVPLACARTVPVVAFRWLARELLSDSSRVRDVVLEPRPPGLHVEASFEKMNTRLRGRADVFVDGVVIAPGTMRLRIRLADVGLELVEDADTPVAALLNAGALDLSRPATLLGYMVRSPVIMSAERDVVELELTAHPRFADDDNVGRMLTLVSSLVTVQNVHVDPEHLEVQFRGLPFGVAPAVEALREQSCRSRSGPRSSGLAQRTVSQRRARARPFSAHARRGYHGPWLVVVTLWRSGP